jgi:hypothetical protein
MFYYHFHSLPLSLSLEVRERKEKDSPKRTFVTTLTFPLYEEWTYMRSITFIEWIRTGDTFQHFSSGSISSLRIECHAIRRVFHLKY